MKVASISLGLASTAMVSATWDLCPDFDTTDLLNKCISVLQHLPKAEAANATAQELLIDDYFEVSNSIYTLSGLPVSCFPTKGESFQDLLYKMLIVMR